MRLKKPLNQKKVDEYTNFIINNLGYAQSVNILIENAKSTAEYMVNNNCKIEDFHIYLDKEKRAMGGEGGREQKEEKGFFSNLIDKIFSKKTPAEEIQEKIPPKSKERGPIIFGKKKH